MIAHPAGVAAGQQDVVTALPFPSRKVLGVGVSAINMNAAVEKIGQWIARVIHDGRNEDGSPNEAVLEDIRGQVRSLCEAFPIYEDLDVR